MRSTQHPNAVVMTSNSSSLGNKDYDDRDLGSAEKSFGGSMGQAAEKNRGLNEKNVRFQLLQHY
jgi:hypothetical protein